jgi:hypothetical protein
MFEKQRKNKKTKDDEKDIIIIFENMCPYAPARKNLLRLLLFGV